MRKLIRMYDELSYVLVCRRTDKECNNIQDHFFLVRKAEWEHNGDLTPNMHFNLLSTDIKDDVIKLFKNKEFVFSTLTYDHKDTYVEY